ncbi:GDSL-type esterase/lipase family protein [Eremococcus coleocola]|uniref:GDSL-like protein n=1 Tax=Eremococcus coleocola ACS-139-V-Col8 TaxID=908337 RepID=E4KRC9_9LACT|nr:GDSL-type esterase/lipase family protein [Eremococcus coleocola]EFR30508.1 GDSL-like protein [Eremococcus coleocola ACS-139-V-Col8]
MSQKKRIACLGDSITFGYGIGYQMDTYPGQLQHKLGDNYEVLNFGCNGATVSQAGDRPYLECQEAQSGLTAEADLTILCLGTNDTKAINWQPSRFKADYQAIIDAYRSENRSGQLVLVQVPKIFAKTVHQEDCNDQYLVEVNQMIEEIATANNLDLINLYLLTQNQPSWFWDGLHPNEDGTRGIAELLSQYIKGFL